MKRNSRVEYYPLAREIAMNKELLIEALEIAKDNFDYDAEYHKAEAVEEYIKQLQEGESNE